MEIASFEVNADDEVVGYVDVTLTPADEVPIGQEFIDPRNNKKFTRMANGHVGDVVARSDDGDWWDGNADCMIEIASGKQSSFRKA